MMEYTNNELFEKLARLQWLLHRHQMKNHSARGPMADPSRGQGRVLAMLKLQPEISTKDLSYLLGIRQQSLNELLGKLEKGGYIIRKPSEKDRRVMMVELTEKGKTEQQAEPEKASIFDCLNEEEQAAFGDYLDRVIAALEAQLGIDSAQELSDWMQRARPRMGEAMFQRMREMHMSHGHGHPQHGHEFFGGPDGRGPAPRDMPGAERFSPDYDGPMPGMPGFEPDDFPQEAPPAPSERNTNPMRNK